MEQRRNKRNKMNSKKKIKILVAGVIICLIAFIVVMALMVKENNECMESPLTYSAEKIKEAGGTFQCSCNSLDPNYMDFYFNETGVYVGNRLDNYFRNTELEGGILE